MAFEFMDVQQKDNQLYALLIAMGISAMILGYFGHFYPGLVVLSVIGLTIAVHLHNEKMDSLDTVVCPIGEHCFDVITSKYSEFLGVSVEIYGMLYYTLILAGYTFSIFFSTPEWFSFFLLANTSLALLFSAYLTWTQAVPIGKWCVWCVTSALCCVGIFSFAVLGLSIPMAELLGTFQAIPQAVYFFSIALGMGVTLAGDALFLGFLKDFEMSETQAKALNYLNEMMWAAVAFAVLGGAGYFYANPGEFFRPENLVSAVALGAVIVNGLFLYLTVLHKLSDLRFKTGDEEPVSDEMHKIRHLAFTMLGFSAASWLTVFFLTFAQIPEVAIMTLVQAFAAVLVAGGLGGLTAEYILRKSARGELKSQVPLLFD